MRESDRSHILGFLFKIIDDNQSTIRFLDTKAAFGIAVIGAIVAKLFEHDRLLTLTAHGRVLSTLSVLLVVLIATSATLGYKTIFPTINPCDNVCLPDNLEPKFFISKFECSNWLRLLSSNKKFAKLKTTHFEYCASLMNATDRELESVVAGEVLKLSFIRQLKTDRLSWFARVLILTVLLFLALSVVASREETIVSTAVAGPAKPTHVTRAPASKP